ncbi:hypothetical protein K440DRAFT_665275 [Wilcoxina mikolae CBS 423.85]|nr:hypothetical protein K440DRAFT_665275 [Wilcoxina mikolae CBS 423.85]
MHLKERQFLEHGYRTHDIFEGSLGRRKMWQKVADSVRHEEHPRSSTELSRAHKNHIRRLMAAVFVSNNRHEYKVEKEAQMYPLVQETLHKILSDSKNDNQVAVIDTNNSSYLPGIAPDMSLSLRNMVRPLAACMYGVLELKRCADKELQDDENLGQVYDYLVSIKRSQPNRHVFLGILSNIRCSVVMTIEGDQNRITMHSPASWEDMVVYLLDHVCKQDSVFTPAPPPFTIGIAHMQKQLGVTRRSMVASFQYLNHGSIAVKCASKEEFGSAIQREVSILRKLTHRNLPQLIYDPSPEALEFGIKPVGRPFALHVFPSASTLRSALLETLSALDWLHTTPNIIHRDIRRDNIILDKLHPVIIDFDHAVDLSIVSPTTTFLYEGGYICCPREVLNRDDLWSAQYRPKPAHDLSGFLLFVVECLFPSRVAAFRSSKVLKRHSSERGALLRFWREMEESDVWGRWLRAAESRDVEMLRGVVELVAWPSTKGCEVGEVRVVGGGDTNSGIDSFESVNDESSGSIV